MSISTQVEAQVFFPFSGWQRAVINCSFLTSLPLSLLTSFCCSLFVSSISSHLSSHLSSTSKLQTFKPEPEPKSHSTYLYIPPLRHPIFVSSLLYLSCLNQSRSQAQVLDEVVRCELCERASERLNRRGLSSQLGVWTTGTGRGILRLSPDRPTGRPRLSPSSDSTLHMHMHMVSATWDRADLNSPQPTALGKR